MVQAAPAIAGRLCDVKSHNSHCLAASMLKKSYALCPSVQRTLEIVARAVAVLLLLLKLTEHTPRSSSDWRSAAEVAKFTDRLSATAASYRCARLFTNACECSVRDVPASLCRIEAFRHESNGQ